MTKWVCASWVVALALLSSCQMDPAQPAAKPTDSGTSMQLNGQFRSAVIGRRTPDGKITTECHDASEGADAAMRSAPAPAARRGAM
jgi:hypothetical protein